MPNKIYIIHASTGSGHKTAANAIMIALHKLMRQKPELGLDKYKFEMLDILDFGRARYDGDASVRMLAGKLAIIHDITWRRNFTGRLNWGGGTAFFKFFFPKLREKFDKDPPACVICTHMVAANVAAGARSLLGMKFPIVSVPTDYETEGLWPHRETDVFCVADEWMKETLLARKVPEDHVIATGIPCHPGFSVSYNVEDLKERLGLPQNKILLLCEAGASMSGPYLPMRKILLPSLERFGEFENIHMTIVAGRDEKYIAELKKLRTEKEIKNIDVLGFTNEMDKLLNVADYALCKAGGLTVTECLCTKTPMILVGQPYAQEKINTWMLDKYHVATCAIDEDAIYKAIKELNDKRALASISMEAILKIRKPNAAEDIAEATYKLIKNYNGPSEDEKKSKKPISLYIGNKPAHRR
ncbi:MAG: UDP-N-acetylglucosamine--LPS N-acetylglucosamine transferase [Eggerthellaceae bacterium]|nr:UDP-N-acetylglucosamine--LPS N-acetylglucosamine transferase [Eggerthellaceae bacterium]